MMPEEDHRFLQQLVEAVQFIISFFFLRRHGFQFDAGPLCQVLQRFAEIPTLFFHDELKDIAAFIAFTETAPGAAFRENHKRGGAGIGVKWTETGIVLPRTAELYRIGYQVYNIHAIFNFVYSCHIGCVSLFQN